MSIGTAGSVVIDTVDVEGAIDFWGRVLGIEVKHRSGDQFAWMSRLGEGGPSLAFQKVPETKAGKNRLHLDLHVADLDAAQSRIEELGGSKVDEHTMGTFTWYVMADPEGNEFCIVAG